MDHYAPTEYVHTVVLRPQRSEKLILTDVDGVLVDWLTGFAEWTRKYGHYPENPAHEPTYNGNLAAWLLPENLQRGQEIIGDFQRHDDAANLPAFPDAIEFIPKIYDLGYDFAAITSCGDDYRITDVRLRLLQKHFGDVFAIYHGIPPLKSKEHVLKGYAPNTFMWLDDSRKHVEHGTALGHRSIHFNRDTDLHPDLESVRSWAEVYAMLQAADADTLSITA